MPRLFDGTDDRISVNTGGWGTLTNFTIAAIVRLASEANTTKAWFAIGTGSNPRLYGRINGSEQLVLAINGTQRNSATTILIADGWCLIAITKTAGTTTPVGHIYKYAANTWAHENLNGTLGDAGATGVAALIGAENTTTPANFYNGDIAIVGVAASVLTNDQIETLAYSKQAWYALMTAGGWDLLDESNIMDWTGLGATQSAITGTSVTAVAQPLSYGFTTQLVERILITNVTGTGALTLPSTTVSGTGAAGASGTGALTLPSTTVAGTGSEGFTATGALTLPSTTVAGTGAAGASGTGALTLPSTTISGTGAEGFTATGALTLPSTTVSGTGTERFTATGALALPSTTVAGQGAAGASGTGALVLPAITVSGTGTHAELENVTGTGALTLPAIVIAGTGTMTVAATGGGNPHRSSGSGRNLLVPVDTEEEEELVITTVLRDVQPFG